VFEDVNCKDYVKFITDEGTCMENPWNNTDRRKPMHSEENLSAVGFSTNSITSRLGLDPVSAVTAQQITTSGKE
jgi:hypothetical protein